MGENNLLRKIQDLCEGNIWVLREEKVGCEIVFFGGRRSRIWRGGGGGDVGIQDDAGCLERVRVGLGGGRNLVYSDIRTTLMIWFGILWIRELEYDIIRGKQKANKGSS